MDDNYLALVIISALVFLILVIFIISFAFLFQRRQLQNVNDKTEMKAAFQQEIYKSQTEIQNQTMQAIGKELHDNIGQLLTVAKIHLQVIEDVQQEDQIRNTISAVSDLISTTINEVRQLTKSLDGDFVKDFGLLSSLRHELERIQNTGRLKTELLVGENIVGLGFQKEIILFRIVQEALNNAIKHSEANYLSVAVVIEGEQLELTIRDNGKGFTSETTPEKSVQTSGAGLRNMKSRTELLGGTFNVLSQAGPGTKIFIIIPLLDP